MLNFSENCTPEILAPYLDGIVSKLLVLLQVCFDIRFMAWMRWYEFKYIFLSQLHLCFMQNGKQMVQEGALTALASVADSSQVILWSSFHFMQLTVCYE